MDKSGMVKVETSGVLCDWHIPIRLKEIFCRITIKPDMTYGVEGWPIKKPHMHKMSAAKMRILEVCHNLKSMSLEYGVATLICISPLTFIKSICIIRTLDLPN